MKKTETDLIQELLKSVEVLGVDATTNALKVARGNTLTLQDKRVEFVLKMVSEHYTQSIEDIINSHNKSNKRVLALKFSIYFLYEVFDFSFGDLKMLFKRDKSLLSRSTKEIREMIESNPNIKSTKNKFDLLITDFKLKNNF
jgi:chromosomal replication initiation ATPase DnaA